MPGQDSSAEPEFVRYPRATDALEYGSVDRLQALQESAGVAYSVTVLAGVVLFFFCLVNPDRDYGVKILSSASFALIVELMMSLSSGRIARGLERENWKPTVLYALAILPSILLLASPISWIGALGFFAANALLAGYQLRLITPEMRRYGIRPFAMRGPNSPEAVLARRKRDENSGPRAAEPIYSSDPPRLDR